MRSNLKEIGGAWTRVVLLELRVDVELQEYLTGGRKLLGCLIVETKVKGGGCRKHQQVSGYGNC